VSGGFKVWPKTSPAATDGQAPPSGSTTPKVNQKTLMWAGAAVVALVALVASRGGDPATDPEATGTELDTRETDLYNELQPELENVADRLEELGDAFEDKWPPRTPTPTTPQTPTTPPPAPVPHTPGTPPAGGDRTYRVKNGDTLKEIAKRFKVPGGAAQLYAKNRAAIVRAAKEHKDPHPKTTRKLYAGTVLVIPGGKQPHVPPTPAPAPSSVRQPFHNGGRPVVPVKPPRPDTRLPIIKKLKKPSKHK